jgi:hypothetical protein
MCRRMNNVAALFGWRVRVERSDFRGFVVPSAELAHAPVGWQNAKAKLS